jgi:hypothetical protein
MTSVTLDQMAEDQAVQTPPDLTKIKLDADGTPELFKGKTVAEVIEIAKGLGEAVKVSESARLQAEATAKAALSAQPKPVEAPPKVDEPKEMTPEELSELYSQDPIRAIATMQQQSERRVEKNLAARLEPLMNGGAASAEANARSRYSTEFELFGDQISQMAARIPGSKQVLANPAAWDDLVAYVRGQPANFQKLLDHQTAKVTKTTKEEARTEQVASVGFTETTPRRPAPTTVASLDATQLEIARNMNLTPEEYVKWSRV